MPARTTETLAQLTGATLIGNNTTCITGAQPLRDAAGGDITLLDDASKHKLLDHCQAAAVVVPVEIPGCPIDQLVAADPHKAFTQIVSIYRRSVSQWPMGVSPAAVVDPTAQIAKDASIGPGCVIGADVTIGPGSRLVANVTVLDGCTLGKNVTLNPGVVLYENTVLEDCVTIHGGAILGAHGFGYRQENGCHQPTGQLGYVHVESDVEIGAASTIDRGTYGATRIGQGTKIDNQVQIAHNCKIGKHNLLCSQVGIAGSSSTGDYVVLAGQVGVADHLQLGNGVIVGAQAGVMTNCEAGNVYLGSPAMKQKEQMQLFALQRKLPEMRRSLKAINAQLDQIVEQQGEHERRGDNQAA